MFLEAYASVDSLAESAGINEGNEVLACEILAAGSASHQEDIPDLRAKSQQ